MGAKSKKPRISKQFSEILQQRLRDTESNPRKLAVAIDQAYNGVRMIYNGETFPGPDTLIKICKYLELDIDEMKRVTGQDKALSKNNIPLDMLGDDFLELYYSYNKLSDLDKIYILSEVKRHTAPPSPSFDPQVN